MLALKRHAEERVSIELLAPEPQFWYRPLSVAEPFGLGHVHGLDLSSVANDCGALFTLGQLGSVDADRHIASTSTGAELDYDALLIAVGARPVAAVPGAFTFRGPPDTDAFSSLLRELADGTLRRVVFALPGRVGWPLPLYELALQTASWLERRQASAEVIVITHEEAPLELFGPAASTVVAALLAERRINLRTSSYAVAFEDGSLQLKAEGAVEADRVVALPPFGGALDHWNPNRCQG